MPVSRVFTIPPAAPFLPTLVRALLEGALVPDVDVRADPLILADSIIFLPTRRAVRRLQDVLIGQLGGSALLPRIAALGDLGEGDEESAETATAPVIDAFGRKLVLARLVRHWAMAMARSGSPPVIAANALEAVHLAGKLGELIDSFETEEVPWDAVRTLVPDNHAAAWEQILSFLNIAAEWWPQHMQATGGIGAARHRSDELAAVARLLGAKPQRGVVIAAGSTGSAPATAGLLATIATLPRGAVVLPGLDQVLDEESWHSLDNDAGDFRVFSHPQRGLNRLLQKFGLAREDVEPLGRVDAALAARQKLVSTALRPAATTDLWNAARSSARSQALDGVTLLEAANESDEALCIAVALRQVLETPGQTAALITPDRALARGVIAELARWDVSVDDSAGCPLSETPAGIFALLAAVAFAKNLAAETLLPLLTHPLFSPPVLPDSVRARIALELGVLRGAPVKASAQGLRGALEERRSDAASDPHAHPARKALADGDWQAAGELIGVLESAQAAFADCTGEPPLAQVAACHRAALAQLGGDSFFTGNDGEVLEGCLARLEADNSGFAVSLADYPAVLRSLMQSQTVRPARQAHPSIAILGLLEARLLDFDKVVLGGLNEGNWPPDARNDPWLSRPMRAQLGLPPPEWRLGLTAHDFEQAMGGRNMVLSRALKAGGAPTVPARWLLRLEAAASPESWQQAKARGDTLKSWAEALDSTDRSTPLAPPAPCPPVALRPSRLSVTEVETLIRDPYHIYARKVLALQPLEGIGLLPSFSERGSLVHDALAAFVGQGHEAASTNALPVLMEIGKEKLSAIEAFPALHGVWSIQFRRIAQWFLPWEAGRQRSISRSWVEVRGETSWTAVSGRRVTLSARADRVDEVHEGGYAIIDYKTGQPPSKNQVEAGFAPQMTLEAALVGMGGFAVIPQGDVGQLTYVHLSGGQPAGRENPIRFKEQTVMEASLKAYAQTRALIDLYEQPDRPYASHLRPQFLKGTYTRPYDHLARVAEWGAGADEDEGETDA
jgi:ATP-dependent helicase/nuclease subunit B